MMDNLAFIKYIRNELHNFMGSKVHLILEDNYIDPKDDLNDAMDFIANVCKCLEHYITDNSRDEHDIRLQIL